MENTSTLETQYDQALSEAESVTSKLFTMDRKLAGTAAEDVRLNGELRECTEEVFDSRRELERYVKAQTIMMFKLTRLSTKRELSR